MANGYSAEEAQGEAEYATGGARFVAGFLDVLLIGSLAATIFLLFGISPLATTWFMLVVVFAFLFGVLHMLLGAAFEASRQRSVG